LAIGSLHVEWLSRLAERGMLPPGAAILDLGPQDIQVSREYLSAVARRHQREDRAASLIGRIFDGAKVRADAQAPFYEIFGAQSYCSVDGFDPRATHAADLNLAVPDIGRFDVITNFGTVEHVFNIGEAFGSIHRLLRTGGVSLHAMPAFAFIDHGFYNVHPCFFFSLAAANYYELVDVQYVDNFFVRTRTQGMLPDSPFDFGSLPITGEDMRDLQVLMGKAARLFARNIAKTPPKLTDRYDGHVFDICLAAMRRTPNSPSELVAPVQTVFTNPPAAQQAPQGRRGIVSRVRALLRQW
jgi:SAM-dependent methyltransferase